MKHITMKKLNPYSTPKLLLTAIIIVLATLLPASGLSVNVIVNSDKKEKKVEYTVPISEFKSLSASNAIKVVYTQGPFTGKAKVTTSQTGSRYLKVAVSHGTLKIFYDVPENSSNISINGQTVVTVQSPYLNEVALSSAAKLEVAGGLNGSAISFNLSSAAKATVKSINSDNLRAVLSSSASLDIEEFKGNASVETSSASKVTFGKFSGSWFTINSSSASYASINKFSGGNLSVWASSGAKVDVSHIDCMEVAGSASSGGKINFSGKCAMLSKSSSSGGSVDTGSLSESKKSSPSAPSSKTKKKKQKNNNISGNRGGGGSGNLRIP